MLTRAMAERRRNPRLVEPEVRQEDPAVRPATARTSQAAGTEAEESGNVIPPYLANEPQAMEPLHVTAQAPIAGTYDATLDATLSEQLDAKHVKKPDEKPAGSTSSDPGDTALAVQLGSEMSDQLDARIDDREGALDDQGERASKTTADKGKQKEAKEEKDKPSSRDGSEAGADTPAEPEAKKGGKQGGSPGRARKVNVGSDDFGTHKWAPPTPLLADTTPVPMVHTPLYLRVDTVAFDAPRAFPLVMPRTEKPTPQPQSLPAYRSEFAEAATVAYDLFLGLRDGAQRVASESSDSYARLADSHRSNLSRTIDALDWDLVRSRAELMAGRDATLARLQWRAGLLRRHISGTASAQLARLDERKRKFDQGRLIPRLVRFATEGYAAAKVAALKEGLEGADKKLKGLQANNALINVDGAWSPSINEAMDKFTPKVVKLSLEALGQMQKSVGPLEKLVHCLPCQFDGLFMGIDLAAERVGKAGPDAVREARDGGLSSLREAELQMKRSIIESAAATDDAMVKQHDAVRARLIESAAAHLEGQQERTRTLAGRQIDMLLALASAQPAAVRGVIDRLQGLGRSPEATTAELTTQASRRLKASLARTAARQPMAVMLATRGQFAGITSTTDKFHRALDRNREDVLLNSTDMSQRTLEQLDEEIDKLVDRLAGVPQSLIKLCAKFFEPDKPPYTKMLEDLGEAVNKTFSNVYATFEGGQQNEEKKEEKPPPPKDTKKPGETAPLPKSCDATCTEKPPEPEKKPETQKLPPGQTKPGEKTEAPPPKKGDGPDLSTPVGMTKYAKEIAGDVTKDRLVGQLHENAKKNVKAEMERRSKDIKLGLAPFFPNRQQVLNALHGTTAPQGGDFRTDWGSTPSLDDTINTKFWRGVSAYDTKKGDCDAALNALNGKAGAATIAELRAAFNLWDDNQKAFDALLALTPDQLASMSEAEKKELEEMAGELEGVTKEKFQALIKGDVATYNALSMKGDIKTQRDTEGVKGWTGVGNKLGEFEKQAGRSALSYRTNAANPAEREVYDQFGIDPTEDGRLHSERMWKDTVLAFGKIELGEAAATKDKEGKELSAEKKLEVAQDALIKLATETRTHVHEVSGSGDSSYTYETTDVVDDEHKKWIERIVRDGSESDRALAARLAIAEKTKDPKLAEEHTRAALHFASADAVEGGKYNEEKRARGLEHAEEKRAAVLTTFGQDKEEAKTGKRPEASTIDIKKVAEGLQLSFETTHAKDKLAQEMLVGIVKNARGDPLATIEYAISKENKDMIIAQFKRMDRKEIEALVKKYNDKHKPRGEKGLDEILGINGHHWTWRNWNGAIFSGDDANEIEIARMGVPQNPKERGETALRIMDQQISQSSWLGQKLAGAEYDALVANAKALREQMGITEADVDQNGYISVPDPLTGKNVRIGNFDENGEFVPPEGGNADAFEKAVAMAKVTAENYTAAVDRISNFVATALVVIAAVVTTVLTGGAAASIWIPMLVTAAAGLAGMGFKMAMKGGRYGRDEMVRDVVSTIVQTATAGIGAAAGVLLRGGPAALKALAGSWRMSEQALAAAAGKTAMLRSLTLVEELAIGAGTSAIGSTATTALDPAMRRREDYSQQVWGSFFRGALSGAVSAGATRGVMGASSRVARSMGASSGAKDALARGASPEAAARFAALRSRAYGTSALTEIGSRSLATGVSGALSRAAEMKFDEAFMGRKYSSAEFWSAMAEAFAQGAIQGGFEAAGDRSMRRLSSKRAAEHAFTQKDDFDDFRRRGLEAAYKEAVRIGLIESAPVAPAQVAEAAPPQRPPVAGAPAEAGAAPPSRPIREGEAAPLPGVRPIGEGAPLAPSTLRTGVEGEPADSALPRPTIGIDETGGPVPVARRGDEAPSSGRPADRTALADADEPLLRAVGDPGEPTGKTIVAANDNGPTQQRIALASTDMVQLGRIAEGTVIAHPDTTDRMAANDNFGRMILADPAREVALLRNPITGEHIVIQGGKTWVGGINPEGKLYGGGSDGRAFAWQSILDSQGGHWIVEHHYHPNRKGETATAVARRLPTGAGADFSVIIREATAHGYVERSSRIYFIDEGKVAFTDFGVNRGNPDKPYWIDVPDPVTKNRMRYEFGSMAEYHTFVSGIIGENYPMPKGFVEPSLAALPTGPPARALESGSVHQALSPRDRSDIHAVVQDAGRAQATEVHGKLRNMGLVGETDSMARLHLVLNDGSIPIDTKRQLATLVLEANRSHMIAAGTLHPDEPIHLIFHGAPEGRSKSIRQDGINLSRLKGGSADDFGKGLYFSRDLESAYLYARRNLDAGEVFPFLMRQRDLGEVVDVREGGKHRSAWDEFLDREPAAYPPYAAKLKLQVKNAREWATATGKHRPNEPERGLVFEAFLKEQKLTSPAVIHGELGKDGLTGGIGRGDQFSLRSQHVASMFNEQLGFRRTQPTPVEEPILRAIDDTKPGTKPTDTEAAPDQAAAPPRRWTPEAGRAIDESFEATFDMRVRETQETPAAARARQASEEAARARAIEDVAWRLAASGDPDGQVLARLMVSAPEPTRAILQAVAEAVSTGRRFVLSPELTRWMLRDLVASGMPRAARETLGAEFARILEPGARLGAMLAEQMAWSLSLGPDLQQRADAALNRRLDLLAARQFRDRVGQGSEGPTLKRLMAADEDAVMDMLSGTGTPADRTADYIRKRVARGASLEQATADAVDLRRVMTDPGFRQTRRRWHQRHRDANIVVEDIVEMVRRMPDQLLPLAYTAPDLLLEMRARLISKLIPDAEAGNRTIDAQRFAAYVRSSQISLSLPLVSEMSAVWSLFGPTGFKLLKSDATSRGRTNQGGLDIVGFSALPGRQIVGSDPVRVAVIDDKAYRSQQLDAVSAMTGERLWKNLYSSASEIELRVEALRRSPIAADPAVAEFITGATKAVQQMREAAFALEGLPAPPAHWSKEAKQQFYLSENHVLAVADIMRRHNIVLMITSEYGQVNKLGEALRRQGFYLDTEYLRRLAREIRRARGQ